MKGILLLLQGCILYCFVSGQNLYPASKTVDSIDIYWGVEVKDPYRWIENLKDTGVLSWFKAQSEYTAKQLARISGQQILIKELKELSKITALELKHIAKAGGKYFYQRQASGESANSLFYREGNKGDEVLLFNPQTFISGKTVDYRTRVSDDGTRIILIISEAGAELGDIHILDVATRKFYPDKIPHATGRFAGGSNSDIVYLEYASSDPHNANNILNCPFKLHVLGTPLSTDIILASNATHPELKLTSVERPWVSVYGKSPFIILEKSSGGDMPLFYALKSELKSNKMNWKPLATMEDEVKDYFINGNDIYLLTSKGNPKFRIIKTSLTKPDLANAETIAEGNGDWKISGASATKDHLLINFSKNELITQPRVYSFASGKTEDVHSGLSGNSTLSVISSNDNEVELLVNGWTVPFNRYSYDLKNKTLSNGLYHLQYNGIFPQLSNLVYEEIEVSSHDGVLVPLSILYNKTLVKKDGSNACLLAGYGAYGANAGAPYFERDILPMVNRGFIIAIAHVRGGGEKGNDWHLAGKKVNKPNSWKDFNACTDWLINNNYTTKPKMSCIAGSAGGILIGRAITDRPELYKAAICKVGMLNALRIEFMPSGPTQIAEFGTVKDSMEFKALLEMDAYQQTKKGVHYPAQLITASFKDFRVQSYMPAKFAARMQAASHSSDPVLLQVDYEGGHSGSSIMENYHTQTATEWSFLLWQTGHPDFQLRE